MVTKVTIYVISPINTFISPEAQDCLAFESQMAYLQLVDPLAEGVPQVKPVLNFDYRLLEDEKNALLLICPESVSFGDWLDQLRDGFVLGSRASKGRIDLIGKPVYAAPSIDGPRARVI